jgi:hypothetical protein
MKFIAVWAPAMMMLYPMHQLKADDWIGLPSKVQWVAGLQYTDEQNDDHSTLFYLSRSSDPVSLDLQYSESVLSDDTNRFDSDSFNANIRGSITDSVELGVGYRFQGQRQQLEIELYSLQIACNPFPFFSSLEYADGDLYIYTREDLTDSRIPDSVRSDMNLTSLQLGWWFDDFSLSASYQQADYEVNVSALDTRPLIQYIVKPSALAQSGLLVAYQSSISLNFPLTDDQVSLHLMSTTSAVDHSDVDAWQCDWLHLLDRHFSLLLSVNRSDNEEDNWSFSAGLEWNS